VSIEVAHADNALRVPAAALRFQPSDEVLKELGYSAQDIASLRADKAI